MPALAVGGGDDREPARRPEPALLWLLAVAGCLVGAAAFLLAFRSDHVSEPGLQASLYSLITVPYILGGALAWWRRPDSRFGPLMIAAGFTAFIANLAWANAARPATIGQLFDLVPLCSTYTSSSPIRAGASRKLRRASSSSPPTRSRRSRSC